MTDKTEAQPEALELADRLIGNAQIDECEGCNPLVIALERAAAAELRRLHAETEAQAARIAELEAQLSARQAEPLCYLHVAATIFPDSGYQVCSSADAGAFPVYAAAPPPPEREPLSETEVRGLLESAGYWPGEDAQRADFINGLRYCEMAHGIGATNDNP